MPLKWKRRDAEMQHFDGEDRYESETQFGQYDVCRLIAFNSFILQKPGEQIIFCDSIEHGKRLAQKDFDKRNNDYDDK